MSDQGKVSIARLHTGVPGLDEVLGGGIPEYSFNLIAGSPGSGKSTLALQVFFANTSRERPGLYFTVLGEPTIKMLRYQQQFRFFDLSKVDDCIRFVNLSQDVLSKDMGQVLASIVREVEAINPGLVVVDSFRTVVRAAKEAPGGELELQDFVQRLALHLTTWQATSFLVGEYLESEMRDNPVLTVADGILWLTQAVERNSIVRKLQVMKMRGQAPVPGLHILRITDDGIEVYPRLHHRAARAQAPQETGRLATGVPGLDEMLGGGVPGGDAVLVAGPSGCGKSLLAIQFAAEGVCRGEPAVVALFEEQRQDYLARALALGFDLQEMIDAGTLRLVYLRPLDLSVDETLHELKRQAEVIGARRVIIDSIAGFELALAPTFREDFRESLYRLVGALTGGGITVMMVAEVVESYSELRFSPHVISFLADDIILLRYVEIEGELRRVVAVVKMRRSRHSRDIREYEITDAGLGVGDPLRQYAGLLTGVPMPRLQVSYPGLVEREVLVLRTLAQAPDASLEELGRRTELTRTELTRALNRLVALGYAQKVSDQGRTAYRVTRGNGRAG